MRNIRTAFAGAAVFVLVSACGGSQGEAVEAGEAAATTVDARRTFDKISIRELAPIHGHRRLQLSGHVTGSYGNDDGLLQVCSDYVPGPDESRGSTCVGDAVALGQANVWPGLDGAPAFVRLADARTGGCNSPSPCYAFALDLDLTVDDGRPLYFKFTDFGPHVYDPLREFGCAYFQETDQAMCGAVFRHWLYNGRDEVFGIPIRPERPEELTSNQGSSSVHMTQWFDRARIENGTADGQGIGVGRLGAEYMEKKLGTPWSTLPVFEGEPVPGCEYFSQTGHSLCNGFRRFWHARGELEVFGYPISEERTEDFGGEAVIVQYFERHRMEWRPNGPSALSVELSRLGSELVDIASPID